jgi:hypothetical protein
MIVFSFSLYGDKDMYTLGMIKNAEEIGKRFPQASVWIYIADDVPANIKKRLAEFKNVKLIPVTTKAESLGMFDRFLAIDGEEIEVMFVRDADSRVYDRDAACIEDFLASDKALHIIRDHKEHLTPVLGGTWGLRRKFLLSPMSELIKKWRTENNHIGKGNDQFFLTKYIYSLYKDNALIHDRYSFYEPQSALTPFRVDITSNHFVGQAYTFVDGKESCVFNA